MKRLLYVIVVLTLLALVVVPVTLAAFPTTREVPSQVSTGETFTVTYSVSGASGAWGLIVHDAVSGGCEIKDANGDYVTSHKFVMLSIFPNPLVYEVTAPSSSGVCTFTGTYQWHDQDSPQDFPTATVTVGAPPCVPDWQCGEWCECVDGGQSRDCVDLNECGTDEGKPAEWQSCGVSCVPDWECTDWCACDDGVQTRMCTDVNHCGVITGKPDESQSCDGSQIVELEQEVGDGYGTAEYDDVELISEFFKVQKHIWYTLIDFTDKDDITCLGTRKSDCDGEVKICADLQYNPDYSGPQNLMLVPTKDVDCFGDTGPVDGKMVAWNPTQYLYS